MNRKKTIFCVWAVLLFGFASRNASGWGGPHATITKAASGVLPDWQKDALGKELKFLNQRYCIIPDLVYSDATLAPYATMDSKPGVRYIVDLHLPATQQENFGILRYFLGKAVQSFKDNNAVDGARYMGTLAHALEDWSCPAHCVPGDNMFTLFKQFLPPPDDWSHTLLHGPIENGRLEVDMTGHTPRLLGESIDEAAYHLLHAANQATIAARGQVVPIIQGLYAGDTNAVTRAQTRAATCGARVVADMFYTVLCLAEQRFEPKVRESLRAVDLSERISLEATHLAMPQSSFFSKPYWGYAAQGVLLRDGKESVPLQLRIPARTGTAVREFSAGIGAGTRSVLSYLLPPGTYSRFEVWAGLHADLGEGGNVVFEVKGNGRSLSRVGPIKELNGTQRISVTIGGVTNLQLITTSGGGDGKSNYAVWGEPRVVR